MVITVSGELWLARLGGPDTGYQELNVKPVCRLKHLARHAIEKGTGQTLKRDTETRSCDWATGHAGGTERLLKLTFHVIYLPMFTVLFCHILTVTL